MGCDDYSITLVITFSTILFFYSAIFPFISPPPDCHQDGIKQYVSPDGVWVAEAGEESCGGPVPPEVSYLTIRRTTEKQNLSKHARILNTDDDNLYVQWRNSDTLEVHGDASAQICKSLPKEFRGIHLHYGWCVEEPEVPRKNP
jgi:hypothetical protein